jgi:hypothetical protein
MQAHVDVNGPVATMVFPKGSEPASGTLVVFDKYGGGELPFDVSLGEPAALKVTGLSRLELNQPRTVGVTVTMKSGSVRILSIATDTRAAVTPGGPIAAR